MVVGLVLVGLGAGLALAGLDQGGRPEALPVGVTLGGVLAVVGVVAGVRGVRGLRARERRRRAIEASPGEPWLADHPWRRDGILDDTAATARRALVGGGVVTVLVSLLASGVLPDAEGPGLLVAVAVLGAFAAIGLWLVARGVLLVLRRARHGLAELRFARFPFLLGGPLEVVLLRDPDAPRLEGLTATLRCVVERWQEREDTDHRDDAVRGRAGRALRREEVWRAERPVGWAHGGRIPIRFELPEPGGAAVGTALGEDPPRYWELSLHADLPGIDFGASFLVPVYEPPAR